MKLKNSSMCLLISLLIVYNVILRYPLTPHEIGYDSFEIHTIANTVSYFGYAKWWLHPTSIFGLYPYSYASAVPFILSGVSQSLSLDMESTIFVFSTLIGIFSAFPMYILAGKIKNDDAFKILAAFTYSSSAGILYFTTWTTSTRGLFIILLPLAIYTLLKLYTSFKYSILVLSLIVLLFATHKLVYFLMPVIAALFAVIVFYKLNLIDRFGIAKNIIYYAIPLCFFILLVVPFFTRTFMESGSRYGWIVSQLLEYMRMAGPLLIFSISGFIFFLFKRNKYFGEWFLIMAVIAMTPFLYIGKYTKWFVLFLIFLLICISLINLINLATRKNKNVAYVLIVILLISTTFTCYYQFLHNLNDSSSYSRHMEEKTYVGATWIKENIGSDKRIMGGMYITSRISSISETPTMLDGVCNLAYDFIDPNALEIKRTGSIMSLKSYQHGFYSLCNTSSSGWASWAISSSSIEKPNSWAQRLIQKFNISYAVDNKDASSVFYRSLNQQDLIYDNGKIRIWQL